ncbi:cytochrome b5-related protein [Euwallacea fornicatus]|uniref:cytochrome b5-related protein n=1 Tax=Euwallacea fornicatus TaxID=995702 RepID=UPI0033905136
MSANKVFSSSIGLKYPKLRDHPLHSVQAWLKDKYADDGAEGYWRIHDNLYDLSDFIQIHPGGPDWIKLTKGTDITEVFESHHLTSKAETLLPKLFLKKASLPRNSPFTFHERGFYKTLKGRIAKKVEELPANPSKRSKLITDIIFASYVSTFLLAVRFQSFLVGAVAGVFLALLAVAAHNFFHQRDNFRRFYFDFSMMSSKEWRVSHVLSHHMYTNTVNDLEISVVEPFLQYLPGRKNVLFRYGSWVYSPVLYALIFISQYLKTLGMHLYTSERPWVPWSALLPLTVPLLSWMVTGQTLWVCLQIFAWVIVVGSTHFGIVGLNAAHHHPDIFHDGDAVRANHEMDWGVFQMDAVMDRKDITGSHFLVLTNFGDHALHHLFPTVDHGVLAHLYPIFLETCEEFGVDWRLVTQLDLVKGQFAQLAKVVPKSERAKSGS